VGERLEAPTFTTTLHTVVRVQNTMQGHPESPRLWEKLIDKILKQIDFRLTKHEPCPCYGNINGSCTLFLRQVDDFAISTCTEDEANAIRHKMNQHLRLPIHNLGIIARFNGMDVNQMHHYKKLHCTKYLKKMTQSHAWNLTTMQSTRHHRATEGPGKMYGLQILARNGRSDVSDGKMPSKYIHPHNTAQSVNESIRPGEEHYLVLQHWYTILLGLYQRVFITGGRNLYNTSLMPQSLSHMQIHTKSKK
jgi:hypothetical protein